MTLHSQKQWKTSVPHSFQKLLFLVLDCSHSCRYLFISQWCSCLYLLACGQVRARDNVSLTLDFTLVFKVWCEQGQRLSENQLAWSLNARTCGIWWHVNRSISLHTSLESNLNVRQQRNTVKKNWNRTQDLLWPEQEKTTPYDNCSYESEGKDTKLYACWQSLRRSSGIPNGTALLAVNKWPKVAHPLSIPLKYPWVWMLPAVWSRLKGSWCWSGSVSQCKWYGMTEWDWEGTELPQAYRRSPVVLSNGPLPQLG